MATLEPRVSSGNGGPRAGDVAFVLVPRFSMIAFTSAIEPLRVANLVSGKSLYRWRTVAVGGEVVRASNDVPVVPDESLDGERGPPSAVVVCAGLGVETWRDASLEAWLRRMARRGVPVGGICTGSLVLAQARLLDGYRCTIHWQNMESFAERFPDHDITATLFEVDRDRFTCSGGTAPIDLMLHLIAAEHGRDLAVAVADQMVHSIRPQADPQRLSLRYRTGIRNAKLLAAIAHMEAHLELQASADDIAEAVGLSTRQLERLFRNHLRKAPSRYYLELRLRRARLLLTQTSMPILQVAVACGFTSASHFARCYRSVFGHAPRLERPVAAPGTARHYAGAPAG